MKRPLLLIALLVVSGLVAIACSDSKNTVAVKTYSGELVRIVADTPKPQEGYRLRKGSNSSETYELRFKRPPYIPPPNTEVTLTGKLEGKTIREAKVLTSIPRAAATAKRTVTTLGTKKVAWIVYTWEDTAAPWTKFEVEGVTLTGSTGVTGPTGATGPMAIKKFYEAESFSKVKVEGHIYGPYIIKAPKSQCNTPDPEAKAKAEADGYIDVEKAGTQYTNVQYVSPVNTACLYNGSRWEGLAERPGNESWINSSSITGAFSGGQANENGVFTMSHEIGHNFGLEHAHDFPCKTGDTGLPFTNAFTGCTVKLYGNNFDILGNGRRNNNFGASEKSRFGWWESSQIKTVTTTGNYTVEPAETNAAGTHLLVIKRPGKVGDEEDYYVEFHQPLVPFSDFTKIQAGNPEYWEALYGGPWVVLSSGQGEEVHNDSLQLFMAPTAAKPETEATRWGYVAVALPPGKTYTNSVDEVKLKTESASSAGAIVKVTFGAPNAPPTGVVATGVSASQVAVTWDAAPGAISYELFRKATSQEGPPTTLVAGQIEEGPRWLDTERAQVTSYEYCVKVVTAEGTSACSSNATGITLGAKPEKGGIVGWVDTGKEHGIAEKTPLELAKVEVFKGAELKGSATTSSKGFWFIKELAAPENTQYTVKITKSGFFPNSRSTVIIPNHAQLHIVNLGANNVGGEIFWKGDGAEALYKQWSRVFQQGACGVESTASNTNNEHIKLFTTGTIAEGSAQGRATQYASKTGDICFEHPRSELGTDGKSASAKNGIYTNGDDVWTAFEFYFPSAAEGKPGYVWGSGLAQWQDVTLHCNPPFGFGTNTEELWMSVERGGCTDKNINKAEKVGAVVRNKWYKVVVHGVFSTSDTTGKVEVFFDGASTPVISVTHHTIHTEGTGSGQDVARTGPYPEVGTELYIAGYTAASTREKAEDNAFNP